MQHPNVHSKYSVFDSNPNSFVLADKAIFCSTAILAVGPTGILPIEHSAQDPDTPSLVDKVMRKPRERR